MADPDGDAKTHRIKVRVLDAAGAGGGAGEPAAPAPRADAVAPAETVPAGDEPVVVSVEAVEPTTGAAAAPSSATEPSVAAKTVDRAKYFELVRENLRLEEDLRRAQGEAYEVKARALAADERVGERQSQLARVQAEFQNFKRRVEKEKEEQARYANLELLRDLLPVLDNFDRAMAAAAASAADLGQDFYKGIQLIHKQLNDALAGYELKALDVVGQPFDPNFHEAVMRVPSESVPVDRVSAELRKGYYYKDRLLRPALVAVSDGGPEGSGDAPHAASGDRQDGDAPDEDRSE